MIDRWYSEWDKKTIIRTAVENFNGMAFQIGRAKEDVVITSDRPVKEQIEGIKEARVRLMYKEV